ncbi:class I SAM-dependent DNA methyltransferase [Halobacterium sp. BOL4-2]|uniref:class I SAM-dependent DNA methyltransferase n=1 Tax=Halobacterium sp. BOL4-2 TaxID=2810537 RepID=UPI0022B6A0CD|nr:class I SAM-dependent DNA methyltransferase [Halobacterium sp. BOL4-2]UDF60538.1 type I restriction-modification system subunit M [Halobacterium sp. BOL4-2]
MSNNSKQIVDKLWNYCDVLRDDGVSYGDYVEQLTYLVFLKMDEERSNPPLNKESKVPEEFSWSQLVEKEGDELERHYRRTLQELGDEEGILGIIFRKAQNRVQDPAKLNRLISLIDEETWIGLDVDIKGEIYEGLLQKNAEDVKSGAGQYFTPRPIIKGMVEVMQPEPSDDICDPACGTGGFFLSAHDYIVDNYNLTKDQKDELQHDTFRGWEIVDNTARLCVMNLYLHGIDGEESPITVNDSLISDPGERFDMVLTNPPFGKKSSYTVLADDGSTSTEKQTYERDDFWTTTSNKQLNFLQHITTLLKINGKAAVVVPDNVLFEGGSGETIRQRLLDDFNLHTILRLPTGIFYAQGVKANVLFFDKKPASEDVHTDAVWYYDLRTNKHFTLKRNPLTYDDLEDFIECYKPGNREEREESERFKKYEYEELIERDKVNLDIFWLEDDSIQNVEDLPEPEVLADDITENLQAALDQFRQIQDDLAD